MSRYELYYPPKDNKDNMRQLFIDKLLDEKTKDHPSNTYKLSFYISYIPCCGKKL